MHLFHVLGKVPVNRYSGISADYEITGKSVQRSGRVKKENSIQIIINILSVWCFRYLCWLSEKFTLLLTIVFHLAAMNSAISERGRHLFYSDLCVVSSKNRGRQLVYSDTCVVISKNRGRQLFYSKTSVVNSTNRRIHLFHSDIWVVCSKKSETVVLVF